jgi:type IV pilus assembly protein PilQ
MKNKFRIFAVFTLCALLQTGRAFAKTAEIKDIEVNHDVVVIFSDDPLTYTSFLQDDGTKIIIEISDSEFAKGKSQKIDGIGQYLKSVYAEAMKGSSTKMVRVSIDLKEKADYSIMQTNDQTIVMLKELVKKEEKKSKKDETLLSKITEKFKNKSGEHIDIMNSLPTDLVSFDYASADLRNVLTLMGSKVGINVIFADDVSGRITLRMNQVPFNEAFKAILTTNRLTAQQMGTNILRIASARTFSTENDRSPKVTKIFKLNYADGAEIKDVVSSAIKAEGRDGLVNVDAGNNRLIVTDTPSGLESIGRLIANLDKKTRQVLIEVKFVEANVDDNFSFGINWSAYGMGASSIGKQGGVNYFGTGSLDGTVGAGQATTVGVSPGGVKTPYDGTQTAYLPLPNSPSDGGTGVNFPTSSGEVSVGAFRFGRITDTYFFDSTLSAAQKDGKAKILSHPKISTVNNKEAKIDITTQIPYTTTEISNSNPPITTLKVTYITTGIQLKVTPTINDDDNITLKLKPSVSQVSVSVASTSGGAPGVDERSVDTTIMTKNNQTVVIGGLIFDQSQNTIHKVPLLGDIPILGWLFKKKFTSQKRIELLIFVTPKLIEV